MEAEASGTSQLNSLVQKVSVYVCVIKIRLYTNIKSIRKRERERDDYLRNNDGMEKQKRPSAGN